MRPLSMAPRTSTTTARIASAWIISYWLPVCSHSRALRPASVEGSIPWAAKAPTAMAIAALSAATTIQPFAAAAAMTLLRPLDRSSAGRHAAVDHQLLAGHFIGGLGAEEQHAVGDVLRLADPRQRHDGSRALARVDRRIAAIACGASRDLAPDRRGDDAGMHRVAADVVGGMLQRHRLGEKPHATLGRRIGGQ